MTDAVTRLAMLRAVADSADIEAQLRIMQGCRPVVTVLRKARAEAADALASLGRLPLLVTPDDIKVIQGLQNEVARFRDLVRWFAEIVSDGFDADQEISTTERDELIDLLARTPEGQEEAYQLGLMEKEPHDA